MHSILIQSMWRQIILALLVVGLTGCVPTYVWVKPGSTQQEGARDVSDCEMRAASAFPYSEQTVITQQGYRTQGQTICGPFGNQVMCNTSGGEYVAPKGYTVDRNEEARTNAYNRCMVGKGWSLREERSKYSSSGDSRPTEPRTPGCSSDEECGPNMFCYRMSSSCQKR